MDPRDPRPSRGGSVTEFLRKPKVTSDFPAPPLLESAHETAREQCHTTVKTVLSGHSKEDLNIIFQER